VAALADVEVRSRIQPRRVGYPPAVLHPFPEPLRASEPVRREAPHPDQGRLEADDSTQELLAAPMDMLLLFVAVEVAPPPQFLWEREPERLRAQGAVRAERETVHDQLDGGRARRCHGPSINDGPGRFLDDQLRAVRQLARVDALGPAVVEVVGEGEQLL